MKILKLLKKKDAQQGLSSATFKRSSDVKSAAIISIHDTTNKILSNSTNYIVDVVM